MFYICNIIWYGYRYLARKFKMSLYNDIPLGVSLLQKLSDKCCPRLHFNKALTYQVSVLFLTYIAYICYHLSRKPISVVKAVLHRNCSALPAPSTDEPNNWCDWAPFDGSDSSAAQMLGELDSAFLFCYAIAMFASGFIAERVNLRYFLSMGMLLSGLFSYLFGLAKTYNIHHLWYYVVVQGLAGVVQTTGWPGVVTVMGNWFGKNKRGLIFGIWNSHTSIGNILGSLIAAYYVEQDWALSFMMPGLYIGVVGFLIFLFLVTNPSDVGLTPKTASPEREIPRSRTRPRNSDNDEVESTGSDVDDSAIFIGEQGSLTQSRYSINTSEVQRRVSERTHLLPRESSPREAEQAIGFTKALKIPGVVEFSLALFFSKLVSYTFLFWLPLYVNSSTTMGATLSADLSTLFDVGGIVGAIMAGVFSDKSDMPATTCAVMLILAAPMMVVYERVSSVSIGVNMILLIMVGVLVNGPYSLITTAVSAELGTHHSLEGNSKALATVTAIIDGTGSIGAAVGPLLAGFVSSYGWKYVFLMLMAADLCAFVLLLRLVKQEVVKYRSTRRSASRIE